MTENKDFGQLVFASAKASGGTVLIRFPAKARDALPARILDVARREFSRLEHSFVVVQPKRTRITAGRTIRASARCSWVFREA
ncbi:MAG TPA: hypothetical protein VGQ88_05850 [Burkholderiales bacterium]|nr:hypothetical protein [Burkholderiales bacterium]